jgi:DNA-binding response OmpR family regulator
MNILVAEDDEASRAILVAQLRKLDHVVIGAADGEDAWMVFEENPPDVVITDWRMPRADGLELCRRIRRSANTKYTYVIILTSLDRKVGFLEGMNAGADDFVNKPCDAVELSVRLRVATRILALQATVHQLEGLLPICPQCRRIRIPSGEWQAVEAYIARTTEAQFSHGICPTCFETKMKPEIERLKKTSAAGQGRLGG